MYKYINADIPLKVIKEQDYGVRRYSSSLNLTPGAGMN